MQTRKRSVHIVLYSSTYLTGPAKRAKVHVHYVAVIEMISHKTISHLKKTLQVKIRAVNLMH